MGIPREAFLATDLVLTMGLSRPGGSSRMVRKLVEVAECRNENGEVGFDQLVHHDPGTNDHVLDLARGSKVVDRIAASWDMTTEEAVENIEARAAMRAILLDAARVAGPRFLEPSWVFRCNEFFWSRMDAGDRDYPRIVSEFKGLVEGRCGHVLV
jgi:hypothetical protein